MSKFTIGTTGVAPKAKPAAAPKIEPHLMTPEEIASRIKVYLKAPTKNLPVQTLMLGIGGCTVPFPFFKDGEVATNRTAEIPAGFEDTEENRAELAAAYADAYLASEEIQAQVKGALTARYFRLQEEKKMAEDKRLASKVAKANLAVKAETAVAAIALAEAAE